MDIKRFDFDYRIAEVLPMLEDKQLYGTKALIRDLKSVVDKTGEIRTKTIDEFTEWLKVKSEKILKNPDIAADCKKCTIWKVRDIDEIAEMLKAGGKNE